MIPVSPFVPSQPIEAAPAEVRAALDQLTAWGLDVGWAPRRLRPGVMIAARSPTMGPACQYVGHFDAAGVAAAGTVAGALWAMRDRHGWPP